MITIDKKPDYDQIARLCKKTFRKHNVFSKTTKDVVPYLRKSHSENIKSGLGFITIKNIENEVIGCLLLKLRSIGQGKHGLIMINHLAVDEKYRKKGVGKELMAQAMKRIDSVKKSLMKSIKVEIHVAEGEKKALLFYKKFGFKVEGVVSDHYRKGEKVYFLGKVVR